MEHVWPQINWNTIEKAIIEFQNILQKQKADSLFTVTEVQERFYDRDSIALNHDPDNLVRTQDLDPLYRENSNLYLFTKNSFNNTKARIGKSPKMLVTNPYESIDIDTEDDWDLAEVMAEFYKRKGLLK